MLSTAFIVLECIIVLFGVYMGSRRGTGCSLIRLIELIGIAVGSLFLGRYVADRLQALVMPLIMDMAGESVAQYAEATANLEALVGGLLGALMVPVFFALFFAVFKLITLIGFGKLSRRIAHGTSSKVKLEKGSKWGGAFVGLVSGMLVAAILLSPIFSYIYIAGNLTDESKELLASAFDESIEIELSATGDRTVLLSGNRVLLLGVEDLFPDGVPNLPINEFVSRLATKATGSETGYSATDAIPELVNMVTDVVNAYNSAVEGGADDLNAIVQAASTAIPHLEESEFLPEVTSTILNAAGEVLKNGGEVAGISLDMENEAAQAVLDSFSDVLLNTSTENVAENMKTLIGSSEEGSAPGVLQSLVTIDFSKGAELLTDPASASALADMLMTLAGNPSMASVMDSARTVGLDALKASGINLFGEEAEAAYVEFANGLNLVIQTTVDEAGDFAGSVDSTTELLKNLAVQYGVGEMGITDAQYKLVSICIVHYFCTEDNYAAYEAGQTPVTVSEVKALLGVN
ncbi:MAG: hypothetical protein J6D21_09540 [Clostridia bacterium]|nr:hypothetical protein [Clostridia bacterium]